MPNRFVDVDYRNRSACYPRSTFYPISDDASTRSRRIIKPDFRLCSTCLSHSQAPLCLYTLRSVTNRAEGTFGRLRYLLGGNHPSQTAHQALSLPPIQTGRLESQQHKGGISRAAPPELASGLQSLPPILHMHCQNPIPSCSKGSGVFLSRCE